MPASVSGLKIVFGAATSIERRLRVVHERPNGTGIVEIPLMVEFEDFTFEGERCPVTRERMAQVAKNFPLWGRGVPFGESPHKKYGERSADQPAFVVAMDLRDDTLWGTVDISDASLFAKVRDGKYRSSSAEWHAGDELEVAGQTFAGWLMYGGVFTNRPAMPTTWSIAAEAQLAAAEVAAGEVTNRRTAAPVARTQEKAMETPKEVTGETVGKDFHLQKVAELEGDISGLRTKNSSLDTQVSNMSAELAALRTRTETAETTARAAGLEKDTAKAEAAREREAAKSLRETNATLVSRTTELQLQLDEFSAAKTAAEVRQLIADATKPKEQGGGGILPRFFDGFAEDPVGAMKTKYGIETIEGFRGLIASLRGLPMKSTSATSTTAGVPAEPASLTPRESELITPEVKKSMDAKGADTTFFGVESEADAKKLWDAEQAKAAAGK